jgi:hypothetical protein
VLQLFRTAASYSASCYVVLRRDPGKPEQGLEEAVAASALTDVPFHIVNFALLGENAIVHGLQMLAEARRRGIDVSAQAYPYTSAIPRIESAYFDAWEQFPTSDSKRLFGLRPANG